MTNVVDYERTIPHLSVQGNLRIGVSLATRSAFLRIGIHINLGHIILRVIFRNLSCMLIRINHVLNLRWTAVAIHIIRNETN